MRIESGSDVQKRSSLRKDHRRRFTSWREITQACDDGLSDPVPEAARPFRSRTFFNSPRQARGVSRICQIEVFDDSGDRPLVAVRGFGLGRGESLEALPERLLALAQEIMHGPILSATKLNEGLR